MSWLQASVDQGCSNKAHTISAGTSPCLYFTNRSPLWYDVIPVVYVLPSSTRVMCCHVTQPTVHAITPDNRNACVPSGRGTDGHSLTRVSSNVIVVKDCACDSRGCLHILVSEGSYVCSKMLCDDMLGRKKNM